MLLKIVNENHGAFPTLTFGDIANQQHNFDWNESVGAYCYQPKSQKECDDIIAANWVFLKCAWRIAPVWDGVMPDGTAVALTTTTAASSATIPPYVNPKLYETYPVRDLLDLCADAGFVPEGDQSNPANLRQQLHRYYEGRAWAAEDMKRLREKVAAQPAPVAAPAITSVAVVNPVASVAAAPVASLAPPIKRGRGRPRREPVAMVVE